MGWILAMFDLPVKTDTQRKIASRFRTELQDNGYLMLQFSVYARPCVTYEHLDSHIAKVESFAPQGGNIRLMYLTDQQWEKSTTIIGPNYNQGNRETDPQMPEQVEFWE